MENNNRTFGSDRMPASKFEELLNKPIQSEDDYFDYVEALYNEWYIWHEWCKCHGIVKYLAFETFLKNFVSFNPNFPPQFFTGDVNSEIVMISLNGHSSDGNDNSEVDATPFCQTWDDYIDYWKNFVTKRYGDKCQYKDNPVSKFDAKLHCFLSGNNTKKANSENLAKWKIFHMELCPFLSSSYPSSCNIDMMKPYLLRVLDTIALKKRELILVLNRQICRILDKLKNDEMIVNKKEEKIKFLSECGCRVSRFDYTIIPENKIRQLEIIALPTFAYRKIYNNDKALKQYYTFAFYKTNEEEKSEEEYKKERDILSKAIGVK